MTTRRTFLQQSSASMAGVALGTRGADCGPVLPRATASSVDAARRVDSDPAVKALALRAVDAAKSAGAAYADARLTRTLVRRAGGAGDTEDLSIGVRALVNGTWGFASSPYWRAEEATQLARDAVAQARANSAATIHPVDLGAPVVTTGSWIMPVRIDPFTVPLEEMREFLDAWVHLGRRFGRDIGRDRRTLGMFGPPYFVRQERAVASTEGSYFTQTTWHSSFAFSYLCYFFTPEPRWPSEGIGSTVAERVGHEAAGWEMMLDAKLDEQFPRLLAEAEAAARRPPLPAKPGDVGRYDVVFDTRTMANLVEGSLGGPTQLDRALGYEANADGTSYLNDPLNMLGSFAVGSPLLNLTAERSTPKSLAWVKWDDEGVEPMPTALVKDGVLTSFQTTREMAGWIKDYYARSGKPARSNGCAWSETAADVPMQHTPNLTLQPGKQEVSFDDMVRDTKKGMAVTTEGFGFDFQGLSGMGGSLNRVIREINNGRLGPVITNIVPFFNTIELWKSLTVLGGPSSAAANAVEATKGQPSQSTWHTVTVVPAKFTNVAFIDPARRG